MEIFDYVKSSLLEGKTINVVFIGDSITSTEWVHPNWREIIEYCLKEELSKHIKDWKIPSWKIRCFNCGFDGSTTLDILNMFDEQIKHLKPTIAIYLENTNEIHYDVTEKQHKKNVQTLLNKLFETCNYVVVFNMISGNKEWYNKSIIKYHDVIQKARFSSRTKVIDGFKEYSKYDLNKFFTFVSDGNPFLKLKPGDIDFVHPNQLGNAYIAKIILEKCFGIKFNPEEYMKETLAGKMFPTY